jgi:hypothetical protein
MSRTVAWVAWLLVAGVAGFLPAAEFALERTDDGVTVKRDGKLLTRYLIKSGTKPILWPLLGPYGDEMTRQYPMRPGVQGERADHPHQRSFWFTHGSVNGVSFWEESAKAGQIVHREFVKVASTPQPTIVTRNDWIGPGDKKQCEDERRVSFGVDGENVWIDFDITLTATPGPVKFGDTKEGTFGLRVAETLKVDAKQGGHIVNSAGQTDGAAWGQSAAWCDYYGPVGGKTVGIAVLNHPRSFRFPTYWHVRTYGLYAANPFGLGDFTKRQKDGTHLLEKGQSLGLYYRVLLHKGDDKEGQVAEAFQRYSALP